MAYVKTDAQHYSDIGAAIREKNGLTTKYKPSQMGAAVRALSGSEAVEWHQCPEAVRNYLANVNYDPSDYSTSQIANYAPATAVVSNYKPIGQVAGGVMHYNEVPNVPTPFASGGKAGTLKPLDALRWIRTSDGATAWNVRDLGGWACDGGTVKYGLLIRGGKLAAADRAVLVGELGIQHDLDLRGREGGGSDDEPDMTESPLGSDVWYTRTQQYAWYALAPVATWQAYLRCVIDAVTHREPVYFHCTAGADRTGTLACVLEGLLGMSQSDIDKDYELTTFYSGSGSDATARRRNESDWKGLINAVNAVSGDTFRDKCVHFAVGTCGMSMADINAYRAAMTNGTPETLHWYQTITKNLTGCTISNDASQVDYGEAYTATIAADSGKTLTSVVVKMGGSDITATAYNADTGVISIAEVTGNVAITAKATKVVSYHNLVPNAVDSSGASAPYTDGKYIGSSGAPSDLSGFVTTGFIPFDGGASHVYRIGGDGIKWNEYGSRIAWYKADFSLKGSVTNYDKIGASIYYPTKVEDANAAAAFSTDINVSSPQGAAYFRVSAKGSGANLIVTLDEPIE